AKTGRPCAGQEGLVQERAAGGGLGNRAPRDLRPSATGAPARGGCRATGRAPGPLQGPVRGPSQVRSGRLACAGRPPGRGGGAGTTGRQGVRRAGAARQRPVRGRGRGAGGSDPYVGSAAPRSPRLHAFLALCSPCVPYLSLGNRRFASLLWHMPGRKWLSRLF